MTQREALDILKTGANVFLTGEPGSGKTHTVNEYVKYLKSSKVEIAITASTGIAATHIGGMTIHSWSGIGIKKNLSMYEIDKIASTERIAKRIAQTKVLIIDEISMLDAGTLDSVERVCRAVRQNEDPFGGMQVVFVGDFFQLPPISKSGEPEAQFAFLSLAWHAAKPIVCYLSEQHRQEDKVFLEILSSLRRNEINDKHRKYLNNRIEEIFEDQDFNMTKLFSHNVDVDKINHIELSKIEGESEKFYTSSSGRDLLVEALKRGCLSPEILELKIGACVMFTKNNSNEGYVNGTIGEVVGFSEYNKYPIVKLKNGKRIEVGPADWSIDDNGKILANINQIPLRLAWAMTVHKSQGMSLDSAFIDLRDAFVEGQGYVALSRVRTLDGLYLAGYNEQSLKVHPEVLSCDEDFRNESKEASVAFSKLSKTELSKMQSNFILAVGGTAKAVKVPTTFITRDFLNQGKTIEEIAEARNITVGTVLSHVEEIISEFPETVISHIRPSKKHIDLVKKHHKKSEGKLTYIKYQLEQEGYELSYEAIRIARLFLH